VDSLRPTDRFRVLMLPCLAILALAFAGSANAVTPTPSGPSLTIEEFCSDFPPEWGAGVTDGAWVVVSGLDPSIESVGLAGEIYEDGVLVFSGGGGSIDAHDGVARFPVGDSQPFTIVVTAYLPDGGVLGPVSRDIDCDSPDAPTSRGDCKDGGWREFDFKNQGDCVSFVATGGKNPAGG
jgi:hypothetical protein